jgi:hypothetical protein
MAGCSRPPKSCQFHGLRCFCQWSSAVLPQHCWCRHAGTQETCRLCCYCCRMLICPWCSEGCCCDCGRPPGSFTSGCCCCNGCLQVVADGLVFESFGLVIDEASLTGESDPIKKNEDDPWCRSGTQVREAGVITCRSGFSTSQPALPCFHK